MDFQSIVVDSFIIYSINYNICNVLSSLVS